MDCRFDLADASRGRADYLAGHIPGAVYAHLDEQLSGSADQWHVDGIRCPLRTASRARWATGG